MATCSLALLARPRLSTSRQGALALLGSCLVMRGCKCEWVVPQRWVPFARYLDTVQAAHTFMNTPQCRVGTDQSEATCFTRSARTAASEIDVLGRAGDPGAELAPSLVPSSDEAADLDSDAAEDSRIPRLRAAVRAERRSPPDAGGAAKSDACACSCGGCAPAGPSRGEKDNSHASRSEAAPQVRPHDFIATVPLPRTPLHPPPLHLLAFLSLPLPALAYPALNAYHPAPVYFRPTQPPLQPHALVRPGGRRGVGWPNVGGRGEGDRPGRGSRG